MFVCEATCFRPQFCSWRRWGLGTCHLPCHVCLRISPMSRRILSPGFCSGCGIFQAPSNGLQGLQPFFFKYVIQLVCIFWDSLWNCNGTLSHIPGEGKKLCPGKLTLGKICPKFWDNIFYQRFKPRDRIFTPIIKLGDRISPKFNCPGQNFSLPGNPFTHNRWKTNKCSFNHFL